MKKSSFVTLILGTISGVLFALGMCMALLPQWNAFNEGVIMGSAGLVLAIVTTLVLCKMEHKKLPKISGKSILKVIYGVVSALVLGLGMCLCLVWNNIIIGTVIGLAGIVMLICLIPMVKGIK